MFICAVIGAIWSVKITDSVLKLLTTLAWTLISVTRFFGWFRTGICFLSGENDVQLSHNFVRTINAAVRAVVVQHIPNRILPLCIFLIVWSRFGNPFRCFHLIPLFLSDESPALTISFSHTHTHRRMSSRSKHMLFGESVQDTLLPFKPVKLMALHFSVFVRWVALCQVKVSWTNSLTDQWYIWHRWNIKAWLFTKRAYFHIWEQY